MIKEVRIPAPSEGARQSYKNFALRQPVDFAFVSVASVLTVNDGVCKDARIVLGAVAPEPVRARSAEEILKGRTVDEAKAVEAAHEALVSANPFAKNQYKVEIAKTLVKRAILG